METEQERMQRLDKEAVRKGAQKVKSGRKESLRDYQWEQQQLADIQRDKLREANDGKTYKD